MNLFENHDRDSAFPAKAGIHQRSTVTHAAAPNTPAPGGPVVIPAKAGIQ